MATISDSNYVLIYNAILLGFVAIAICIRIANIIISGIERRSRLLYTPSPTSSTHKPSLPSSTSLLSLSSPPPTSSSSVYSRYPKYPRNVFRRCHDSCSAVFSPLVEPLGPSFRASGYKVVIFAVIFIVNVVFCTLPLESSVPRVISPFVLDQSPHNNKVYKFFAQCGLIAQANLPALVVFSTRNNILSWVCGIPYQHFRSFHKWVSSLFLFLAVIHSIYFLALKADISQLQPGAALAGMLIITFFLAIPSIRYLRRISYEIFFVFHIIGFIVALVALCLHKPELKLSVLFAGGLWLFDRLVRICRLVYVHVVGPRLIRNSNKNNNKFQYSINPGLVEVTARKVAGAIVLDLAYPLYWKPASHVYISFLGKDQIKNHPILFGQNHPFSVASLSNENSESPTSEKVVFPSSSAKNSLDDVVYTSDNNDYDDDNDKGIAEKDTKRQSMFSIKYTKNKGNRQSMFSISKTVKDKNNRQSILPTKKIKKTRNNRRYSTFVRKGPSPLRLIARPYGKMTQWLAQEVSRQGGVANFHVTVEGPYGRLGGEWKGYDTLALFAAGSGISHVFGIFAHTCQRVSQNRAGLVKVIELRWVFKSLKELLWIASPLLDVLALAYPVDFSLRIFLHVTQTPSHSQFSPRNGNSITATTPAFDKDVLKSPSTIHIRGRSDIIDDYEDEETLADPDFKAVLDSSAVKLLSGRPIIDRELSRLVHKSGGNRVQVHVCGPASFDKAIRTAAVTVSSVSEAFAGRGVVHVVTNTRN